MAVSKLNEKKIASPGSPASSLLSELKLRSIIENARQISKVCPDLVAFVFFFSLKKNILQIFVVTFFLSCL